MILAIYDDGKLKRTIKGDVKIERHNFAKNVEIKEFDSMKEFRQHRKEIIKEETEGE